METKKSLRLLKIPIPADLIRELDEALIANLGGYSTRAEFVKDAIESLLAELKYEPAKAEPVLSGEPPPPAPSTKRLSEDHQGAPDENVSTRVDLRTLDETGFRLPGTCHLIRNGVATPKGKSLFGLHNRDFPSLWAAALLAQETQDRSIPLEAFYDQATDRAWHFAESVKKIAGESARRLTALFPTNRTKPQSASEAFRTFALGTVQISRVSPGDRIECSGPLFEWSVCQLEIINGIPFIGLTPEGFQLLKKTQGITVDWPHHRTQATQFLSHLVRCAPSDWSCFSSILEIVADGPERTQLVAKFRAERPAWTNAMASTNAQGYIARAREWGLVEPRLKQKTYLLTQFGQECLQAGVLEQENKDQGNE